ASGGREPPVAGPNGGLTPPARSRFASPVSVSLVGLLLLGAVALAVSGAFLVEVAAPTLLDLPHHHCAYDLIPDRPGALVAVALYLGGAFFLGWAAVAWWLGRTRETEPFLADAVAGLLLLSLCGYLMSLAMMSLELALA